MDRPQVNIRLERGLLEEIDALAGSEHVDRSEITRRLLNSGLSSYRLERALAEYRRGNVSAWRAADIAGVSLYEMLDRIHEAGIPYEIDPGLLDRLDGRVERSASIREAPAAYGSAAPDLESGIAELREQFKPEHVETLFVGESSPAGGTHFYRANSNLFRATQEAFVRAFGEAVPSGPRFLHWFRDQGCWLVDLADRPINRLEDSERKQAVVGGVERLAELIRQESPERIIAVKASIAGAVRQAAALAGFEGRITELPFPVRQWRQAYVGALAAALSGEGGAKGTANSEVVGKGRRKRVDVRGDITLDDAIEEVLREHGNKPMSTRAISDEIRRRGAFVRPSDGKPPPPSQISARVSNKSYRDRFERTEDGVRLREDATA
jgi:hypothetical protein